LIAAASVTEMMVMITLRDAQSSIVERDHWSIDFVARTQYGGLIASLIDCHSTGTAAAAMYRQEGRDLDTLPAFRFVTGSLHVDYLKPTPIDGPIEIRGRVKEIKGRKVIVETSVMAGGVTTARGEVVAVQMPGKRGLKALLPFVRT
jgi:acyl-coenzyme A thioesterase PaaI-like protein